MKNYYLRLSTPDIDHDFAPVFHNLKDALTYKRYLENKWKAGAYPYNEDEIKISIIESEVEA